MNTEGNPFKFMGCVCVISKDAGLWHLSMSRKDRMPNYEEMKAARYEFFADVLYMVEVFPPLENFVNYHSHTRHLWEPKDFVYSELNHA